MATKYHDTPFGKAVFPHLNKPDSKFNADNPMFKTGLRLEGEAAQNYKARVDAAVDEAFDAYFETGEGKALTPGQRKKWEKYFPYEVEEDDEGNPTGAIVFDYKQNSVIRLRDGTKKEIAIGIYDAKGKEMEGVIVRGGSTIRLNASLRPIPMKSQTKVGVRLDFGRVQVKELAKGNGGGFGAVEGGYEYDEDDRSSGGFGSNSDESGSSDASSSDY